MIDIATLLQRHEVDTEFLNAALTGRIADIDRTMVGTKVYPVELVQELHALRGLKAVLNRLPDAYRKVRACE